jgi:hypothetical protein
MFRLLFDLFRHLVRLFSVTTPRLSREQSAQKLPRPNLWNLLFVKIVGQLVGYLTKKNYLWSDFGKLCINLTKHNNKLWN